MQRSDPNRTSHVWQRFTYDARNRKLTMDWDDLADWADFGYDKAGRLSLANNANSSITRGYDSASRLTLDQQAPTGLGIVIDVRYQYDADDRVTKLFSNNVGYTANQTFDPRGRLKEIRGGDNALWVTYDYDLASNITARQMNVASSSSTFVIDDLNRISRRDVNLYNGGNVSQEHYGYDVMNRLTSVNRWDPHLGWKLDTFGYDWSSQLSSAAYGTGRNVSYTLDKAGNRTQVVDAGVTKLYAPNQLNQYTTGDS